MTLAVTVVTDSQSSADGTTPQGTARFTLTEPLVDTASGEGVGSSPVQATYAGGAIAQPLVANDSATADPSTTMYRVELDLIGSTTREFYVRVPATPPGSRTVTDVVTTAASAVVTSATADFTDADVGAYVRSPLFPVATTVVSVQSSTQATLSTPASASGTAQPLVVGASVELGSLTPL